MNFLKPQGAISSKLTKEQKLTIKTYKNLATKYSLIPLHPKLKTPVENNWTYWCIEKRSFSKEDYIEIVNGQTKIRNAGIACGPASGIVIFDLDCEKKFIEWAGEKKLEDPLPKTFTVTTGKKGVHLYYKYPYFNSYDFKTKRLPGIFDILGLNAYAVAPGSVHPETGKVYQVTYDCQIVPLPKWIIDFVLEEKTPPKVISIPQNTGSNNISTTSISEGSRNNTLLSLAGSMREKGMGQEAIEAALLAENKARCNPPLDDVEVQQIAASIMRYPSGKPGVRFQMTDLGNAERLVDEYGEDIRYCTDTGWYLWNGKIWDAKDGKGRVTFLASQTIRGIYKEAKAISNPDIRKKLLAHALKSESAQHIRSMVDLTETRPSIIINQDDFNSNPWLLNCLNGTVDLKTGQLRPHNRSDLLSHYIPIEFDQNARCRQFETFISQIMANTPVLITYLQKVIGYAITGNTHEQCYFIFHGGGSNGKSTLFKVLRKLLGQYITSIDFNSLTYTGDAGRSDLARLVGKRIVTSFEVNMNKCFNESVINRITGEDPIVVMKKYKEPFEYLPEFKLFVVGNDLPQIASTSYATWRRIHLVPFNVIFGVGGLPKNKELAEELFQELPGILNWCITGCIRWQQEGLQPPKEVTDAVTEYQDDMDTVAGFINNCCDVDSSLFYPAKDLYKQYQQYCHESGEVTLGKKDFTQELTKKGFKKKKEKGAERWLGISYKDI